MREVVLVAEATGLSPEMGHRIIELGCIEVMDGYITENKYHQYFNPQRNVNSEAEDAHGISADFLRDKPLFEQMVEGIINFIDGSILVAHDAHFHIQFLNYEMDLIGLQPVDKDRAVIDTFKIAQQKFPNQKNNLDALCDRFNIKYEHRDLDGALLDSELLAEAYLELKRLHNQPH